MVVTIKPFIFHTNFNKVYDFFPSYFLNFELIENSWYTYKRNCISKYAARTNVLLIVIILIGIFILKLKL